MGEMKVQQVLEQHGLAKMELRFQRQILRHFHLIPRVASV
jgi:hypothetical protein